MKNKINISHIAIFGLIIALIVAFAKINSLESNIELLRNDQNNNKQILEQQISNIYNNVDEQLKKQASLFSNTEIAFGKEVSDNKGSITISVVPKTISDDMVINLKADGQTVTMNKTTDGKYTGTISVDMFKENAEFPLVSITSKGETKTEYLDDLSLDVIWPDFLPHLIGNSVEDVSKKYKDGKLPIKLIVEVGYDKPNNYSNVKFTNCYLLVESNGKEIDRKDMNDKFSSLSPESNITEFIFENTYEISEKDNLAISVVGEDELGYIHRQNIYNWVHPDENGAQPETAIPAGFAGECIYDRDGNMLYGKEYLGGTR